MLSHPPNLRSSTTIAIRLPDHRPASSRLNQSTKMDALHEPAILYAVFAELPQDDLLIIQRVCHSWRATITSDDRLLYRLWLRPTLSSQIETAQPHFNPILKRHFPYFMESYTALDDSTVRGRANLGPWLCTGMMIQDGDPAAHMPRRAAYLYPEASWRNMIPCRPCPNEFQFDVRSPGHRIDEGSGILRCLTFTNDTLAARDSGPVHLRTAHLPWLTFGLIYDLVEAAWFHGIPSYVSRAVFDYSYVPTAPSFEEDFNRYKAAMGTMTPSCRVSLQSHLEGRKQISGPGRVLVSLNEELRTPDEIARLRQGANAYWRELQRTRRQCLHYHDPFESMIFTDEFRVQGAWTVADVDWDEIHEYGSPRPPSPIPAVPVNVPRLPRRSCLSRLLWWKP